MPTPKETRLLTDFRKVQVLVAESGGTLRLIGALGAFPTTYRIEYRCPSLIENGEGQIVVGIGHTVEITLGADYPMAQPSARVLTPIFNPHIFADRRICLGNQWIPTETLDALVLRIGAILQLDPKIIDYKSPANFKALLWAKDNPSKIPLPGSVSFKAPSKPTSRITWS